MPSSYTNNLGIELPVNGELDGVWGSVVNGNMNILDVATNGSVTVGITGTASTLTTTDGTVSDGKYKVVRFAGTPSGTHTVTILPNDAKKVYFVRNDTSQSLIFTQGSGGNVTVPAASAKIIYTDGGGTAAAVSDFTNALSLQGPKITGGSISTLSTPLAVDSGGTGATDAATARTNIGALGATSAATLLNMSTARVLGRTTAGTGAVEELTVGDGLSLSGGILKGASGSIAQTVYASTSTQVQIATTTYTFTGLSATITPKSTASRILITVSQVYYFGAQPSAYMSLYLNLQRNSSNLNAQKYEFSETGSSGTNQNLFQSGVAAFSWIDSPASTSALTYRTMARPYSTANGGYVSLNDGTYSATSFIILQELI